MKIFKYIHIRLSALAFALVISSCSDKLDTQEGQVNTGDIDYTDTSQMIDPLIGAYYALGNLGWEEPLLLGVRGDDVNSGGLGDQPLFTETDLYNYDKDFWMFNQVWRSHYSDIISMNTAIQQIENFMEFANDEDFVLGEQYIAEIKVLRAWLHFNMARNWEEVFIITSNQPEAELEQGVASKEEMMQFISREMDEAIPFLQDLRPNQRPDLTGGVTRYTAYAMKALAQQELENYQGVADAAGAIISSGLFSLYPDFYQLFKKPGELSNESLMELQYTDYGSGAEGGEFYHDYGPFGPQNWDPVRENASPGWGFYEPSHKFIGFMLDRNETVRLQTSVLFTPDGIEEIRAEGYTIPDFVSNVTPSGDVINNYVRANFASGKHYLPSEQLTEGRNPYGAGKNFIIIRYAEVLLIYAEALTRGASGTAMTADEAVNLIRERADMPPLSGVTTEDVLDEKFAELAMEWGIRFYDMIRVDNYSELSYDGRTFSAQDEYLPYPQGQVDALPLGN